MDQSSVTPVGQPLRKDLEDRIAETLAMQPSFKAETIRRWAKLINAAIEPLLEAQFQPRLPSNELTPQLIPSPRFQKEGSVRLEGVMDFSRFLLAKASHENMPNEFALEELVNAWNAQHNESAELTGQTPYVPGAFE